MTGFFRIEIIRHARYELIVMRCLFAYVVWLSVPSSVANTSQPVPNGIANWVDLTFFAQAGIMHSLRWIFRIALVVYASGFGMGFALPVLLFMSVGTCTLLNSQGAIGHTTQIVSLALLAQCLAYLVAGARRLSGNRFALPHGFSSEQLAVEWSRQMIVAAYLVSAVSKLVNSGGRWILDTPNFGLQIVKANDMNYYNTLQPTAENGMEWLAHLVTNFPALAMLFIGSGLILEIGVFFALFNRRTSLVLGLAILLFHSTVSVMMQLGFLFNKWLLVIYFVNLPFWAVALWRKSRRDQTPASLSASVEG